MIIEPDIVLQDIHATSKKHVLTEVSKAVTRHLNHLDGACTSGSILGALLEREKIGSTAIGAGVAIPHIRLSCLDECISSFVRLKTPINFDAADGMPVDLIYVFLAPENAQGKAASLMQLARISNFFRDTRFCDMLRESDDIIRLIKLRNAQIFDAA